MSLGIRAVWAIGVGHISWDYQLALPLVTLMGLPHDGEFAIQIWPIVTNLTFVVTVTRIQGSFANYQGVTNHIALTVYLVPHCGPISGWATRNLAWGLCSDSITLLVWKVVIWLIPANLSESFCFDVHIFSHFMCKLFFVVQRFSHCCEGGETLCRNTTKQTAQQQYTHPHFHNLNLKEKWADCKTWGEQPELVFRHAYPASVLRRSFSLAQSFKVWEKKPTVLLIRKVSMRLLFYNSRLTEPVRKHLLQFNCNEKTDWVWLGL